MHQRILFVLFLSIVMVKTNAQTGLNFQGVARTSNNVILASQPISIKLSILQGSSTGTVEYTETRKVNTNAQGLFTAVIGDTGTISTVGNFATINWKSTPKFLKIEMDPAAGTNFITMGTTQFQYVAYAQFAKSVDAENINGIVPVTLGGTGVNSLTGLKTALILNNVNNTADLSKPISTLTQTALDLKLNAADTSKYTKQTYTDSALLTKLSITGNAATATSAGNITATTNTTLTSLSNLATVGTITSGVWSGTAVAIANGGTGASTKSASFDALSPMTTSGDIIYGSTSGTGTRLAKGLDGQVLTLASGLPKWVTSITSQVISNTATISDPFDFGGTSYALTPLDLTSGKSFSNGENVLALNTSGIGNVGIGVNVLSLNTNGSANTAVGFNSLMSNITGKVNSAFGSYALYNNTTGNANTAIGSSSLISNTTGRANTSVGEWTMLSNTSGFNNTATGSNALYSNTTGSFNTSIGRYALGSNTTGWYNTSIGQRSLQTNTTGNHNTAIGNKADVGAINLENATAIGDSAIVSTSNTIQLGNTSVTNVKTSGTLTAGTVTYPNTAGTAGQVLTSTGSGTLTWTGTHYIGESYGGGIVFYVYDNGKHGLIAATSDQSNGVIWYAGSNTLTSAFKDGINGGISNTERIIISQGYGSYAAKLCSNLNIGNFADWYLPSKYELNLMYTNIGQGAPSPNTNIGGFANASYWSSTEFDGDNTVAWSLYFVSGNHSLYFKNNTMYVRAIRSF